MPLPATSPARTDLVTLNVTHLIGNFDQRGLYSLHLKLNKNRSDLCELIPSSSDTTTPNWRVKPDLRIHIPAGTQALRLEVHRVKPALLYGTPEIVGYVDVGLHELVSEVSRPFQLAAPRTFRSDNKQSPGSVALCVIPTLAQQVDVRRFTEKIAREPALRALKTAINVLDFAKDALNDTPLSASIKAGRVLAGTSLQYLCEHPELVPQGVQSLDLNVVWILSRHVEHHLSYFQSSLWNNPQWQKRAKLNIAQELFPVVSGSLAIIFGFVNVYPSATYGYVEPVSPFICAAAVDLQVKLAVLGAKMRGMVDAQTSTSIAKHVFFYQLAHVFADKFKTVEKPSGSWMDYMECMRGKLAIKMLDGYKAYIDNSSRTNGPGSAKLRSTARRLMALLAYETQMLPSALEIPDKYFGQDEIPRERRAGVDGMHFDATERAGGSYGSVTFSVMQRSGEAKIKVAIKTINAAITAETIKHTYLEILNGWTLRHCRLLATEGITHRRGRISIVSEKMEGGTAYQYVCNERFRRRPAQQQTKLLNLWLKQIADGIKYMHDEGVAHGDLRGANIFINTGDGTDNNIVIGDFGLSICVDAASNMLNSTRSGSERYLAPEQSMPHLTDEEIKKRAAFYGVPTRFISHSNRPTTQTDLFSFAMLCIELYTHDKPFQNLKDGTVTTEIMHGRRPALPKEIAGQRLLSARIERCWRQNPGEREDAGRLLDDMRHIAPYDRL